VYIVTARKGDVLSARIDRFPGRALVLRVRQHANGCDPDVTCVLTVEVR
jgi:hypothetical protein